MAQLAEPFTGICTQITAPSMREAVMRSNTQLDVMILQALKLYFIFALPTFSIHLRTSKRVTYLLKYMPLPLARTVAMNEYRKRIHNKHVQSEITKSLLLKNGRRQYQCTRERQGVMKLIGGFAENNQDKSKVHKIGNVGINIGNSTLYKFLLIYI